MNIAHLIDSGGMYGAEITLINLCLAQMDQGHSPTVISIATPDSPTKPLETKLAQLAIPYTRWEMKPLPDLREAKKIIFFCEKNSMDVIHSHGYKGNILLGLLPRKFRKTPIVTTMHGYTKHSLFSKMTVYQFLDRLCIKFLDAIVLVSESMKHQIHTKNISQKLFIVENGIPTQPSVSHKDYQSTFSIGDFKIGSLGRLSNEKNFGMLIEAFSILEKHIKNAKLVIYGEGPEREYLNRQIAKFNLEKKIQLPGFLSDTTNFLTDIDVFINCSTTEGMPISILEAMRAGCPIVATNIPANVALLDSLTIKNQFCELTAES